MTRMILLSLLLAGLGAQAQTITTTWAEQSIVGVVTNDGNGYTWTAVISTLGPALPDGAAAAPTTPLQAAAADSPAQTTPVAHEVISQSQPGPPPPLPTGVTAVPQEGTIQDMGDYQSSLKGELGRLGTQAFQQFTSAANIQGLSLPQFGRASVSAHPSAALWSGVAGLALAPVLFSLASL